MSRTAEISARFSIQQDPKGLATARASYTDLLRENQRYKERLASQNSSSRTKELAAERQFTEKMRKESTQRYLDLMKPPPVPLQANPAMNRMGAPSAFNFMPGGSSGGRGGMRFAGNQRGGSTNAGMGLLMLSQLTDDAQYGFRSIVNNIAPLVMALGGGVGLAGALTILSVAINQGAQAWDRWTGSTKTAEANAAALKDHLELIAKHVHAAGQAGSASGLFAQESVGRLQAGRTSAERFADRALDASGADDLKKADAHIKAAQENLAGDTAEFAKVSTDLAATQKELLALEAKQAEAEADWRRNKLEEETFNRNLTRREKGGSAADSLPSVFSSFMGGVAGEEAQKKFFPNAIPAPFDETRNQFSGDFPGLPETDQARIAFLRERIPGLSKAKDEREKIAGEGVHTVEDLKLEKARLQMQKGIENVHDLFGAVIGMIDAAGDAAGAAFQLAQARRRDLLAKAREAAAKAKAAAAIQQNFDQAMQDIQIQSLRAHGHNHAADRAQDARDREKMIQDQNFTPQQADSILNARREERKKSGGIGGIHGAKTAPMLPDGFHDMRNANTRMTKDGFHDMGLINPSGSGYISGNQSSGLSYNFNQDPLGTAQAHKDRASGDVAHGATVKHRMKEPTSGVEGVLNRVQGWVNELKTAFQNSGSVADKTKPSVVN